MEINNTKDRDIIGIAEHHLRQPAQICKARALRNGSPVKSRARWRALLPRRLVKPFVRSSR
eukprot:1123381-Pyramimonas_sp.AAC.1